MEINSSMTATPLYPNEPSLAPPIAVSCVAPDWATKQAAPPRGVPR